MYLAQLCISLVFLMMVFTLITGMLECCPHGPPAISVCPAGPAGLTPRTPLTAQNTTHWSLSLSLTLGIYH